MKSESWENPSWDSYYLRSKKRKVGIGVKVRKASPEFLMVFFIGAILSLFTFVMVHSLCKDVNVVFVLIPCIIGTIWIILGLLIMYRPKEDDETKEQRMLRIQSIFPQIFGFSVIGMGLVFLYSFFIEGTVGDERMAKTIFLVFAVISTLSMYIASPRMVKNTDLLFIKDFRHKNILMKISTLSVMWVIIIMIMKWL